jgi:hypothetical protein
MRAVATLERVIIVYVRHVKHEAEPIQISDLKRILVWRMLTFQVVAAVELPA